MTPAQQKKAIAILKRDVTEADSSAGDPYDDHHDTMEKRLFLIRIGAIPDRRKTPKQKRG